MALKSRIPQITIEIRVLVDEAIVQGAHQVAEDAAIRLRPHRRSGELEDQIHVDERQREGVYVIAGDSRDPSFAFYGHMVEHGTSHSPPHPFLVPALEENRDPIVNDARRRLRAL
jgi:HK97 gp10 family phage protein